MVIKSCFKNLFSDCNNLCVIIDKKTQEVLYFNDKTTQILKNTQQYSENDIFLDDLFSSQDILEKLSVLKMNFSKIETFFKGYTAILTDINLNGQELQVYKYLIKNPENVVNNTSDELTGFYHRTKYSNDIERLLQEKIQSLGVIFININGLKLVNSTQGYSEGDKLIAKSAEFLRSVLPNSFYRISGDEFVSFSVDISEEEFSKTVDILKNAVKTSSENFFAIGHSYAKGSDLDILKLIVDADAVMYINKQEYYHSIHKTDHQKISTNILNDVMYAIDNNEFLVFLQPKVNLVTGDVVGAEALVRRHDRRAGKMISPNSFIPIYEKNSVIRHVDLYVLEEVCKFLSKWKTFDKQMPISVNLSRVTLLEYDIVETVAGICKKYGVDTQYILVEITERVGIIENDIAVKLISDFKKHGFSLSLDDFGCAYSNIVTLAKIDVDEVKIDKSLVDDLISNSKNRIIVENILNMCSSFKNTNTVVEGIEKLEQADILRNFGYLYGQGYFYSKPMPSDEFFKKYILE